MVLRRAGDTGRRLRRGIVVVGTLALVAGLITPAGAYPRPGVTDRVSVASDGTEANSDFPTDSAPVDSGRDMTIAAASLNSCGVPGLNAPASPHAPSPDSFCAVPPLPRSVDGAATGPESQGDSDATPTSSSDWSMVPSPNASTLQTNNVFTSTACVSTTDCWAVGAYISNDRYRTLTARWDGTSWSEVPSPNVPDTRYSVLYGVACPSESECWAVGFSATGLSAATYRTLVLRWDGASWTVVESPNGSSTSTNVLYDIACASVSDCWAVGYYQAEIGGWTASLIEHWDGTAWRVVPSTDVEARHDSLNSVTCVSASDCWAVGSISTGTGGPPGSTMIQHWDGGSWRIVTSPSVSDAKNQNLLGVTCVSASDCWAVGLYIPDNEANDNANPPNWLTLIQHWDGDSWSIVASPNGTTTMRNVLEGVTCAAASNCWAVGSYQAESTIGPPNVRTLVLAWDGSSWTTVSSPNGGPQSNFRSVACVSVSDCWTVGGHENVAQTLTAHWDGSTWTIAGSPNVGLPQHNRLTDVECLSQSSCWAVGHYETDGVDETAILWWNGVWWRTVDSPTGGSPWSSVLSGLACTSASDCWAVGHRHIEGLAGGTLIQHWNGGAWSVVESPNQLAARNLLTDIACVSASSCWAVGHSNDGLERQSLILHWDGTAWSVVPTPDGAPAGDNHLEAIACTSESDCWAIGGHGDGGERQSLIVHWDGTSWAVVPSPNTSTADANVLIGIACLSPSDCWAVGTYREGGQERSLALHWDGTAWELVSSPSTSPAEANVLSAVGCASTSDCWAVGTHEDDSGDQILVHQWDGTSWQIAEAPDTSASQANILTAIACLPGADCWAVGSHLDGTVDQTLVLRREKLDEKIETISEGRQP